MPPKDHEESEKGQEGKKETISHLTKKEISYLTTLTNNTLESCIVAIKNEIQHVEAKTGGTDRKKRARSARARDFKLALKGLEEARISCNPARGLQIMDSLMANDLLTSGCRTRLESPHNVLIAFKGDVDKMLSGCQLDKLNNQNCLELIGFAPWSKNLTQRLEEIGNESLLSANINDILQPLEHFIVWNPAKTNLEFAEFVIRMVDTQKGHNGYLFHSLVAQLEREYSLENIQFLAAVEMLAKIDNTGYRAQAFDDLYHKFIHTSASAQVNLPFRVRKKITEDYAGYLVDDTGRAELPNLEVAKEEIIALVGNDTLKRLKENFLEKTIQHNIPPKVPI